MGTPARDSRRARRAARLRVASLDHVLAEGVLLLRSPETAFSRGVCLSATHAHRAADPPGDAIVEVQGGPSDSGPSPRRGRIADYRLAAGGVHIRGRGRTEAFVGLLSSAERQTSTRGGGKKEDGPQGDEKEVGSPSLSNRFGGVT